MRQVTPPAASVVRAQQAKESTPDEGQSTPTFDLRLLCPALIAWATLVVLVVHDARTQLLSGLAALVLAGLSLWFCARGRRPRWHRLGGVTALSFAATALVLIAGAAHRASDEVGPVPDLAQERAVVTVTGTVLTEPRLVTRGDERPDLVIFELRVKRSRPGVRRVGSARPSWSSPMAPGRTCRGAAP